MQIISAKVYTYSELKIIILLLMSVTVNKYFTGCLCQNKSHVMTHCTHKLNETVLSVTSH